ncbi:f-box domain-containing protein [Diaporthe amygdali]|uniref:f-box domain-containing protein n=1 Tax=Phomopsis amygdali TaxID=1214568 RepID=UPI0022FED615|nr:f-box domain-containing protein [Diaporthe amygdali]KAJ0107932.1 f-box domain-containing protein [Diaporthe amygdali]
MDIVELPRDLFLLVVAHLSARNVVRCRRVSRSWHGAFTDPDLNLQLMKWHFPRCREMRVAYVTGALGGPGSAESEEVHDTEDEAGHRRQTQNGVFGEGANISGCLDWTATFANVARRYHHLRTATARSIDTIKLGSTEQGPSRMFYPVAIWDRFLRLDDKTAPFHYRDPAWSYSQEDGLLVYHAASQEDDPNVDQQSASCPWRLLDLETGQEVAVPFPQGEDRIVRRVRLSDRVLVLEWCEREAYHQLNDREECHRHFVTAFDVVRARNAAPGDRTCNGGQTAVSETWAVKFRSQFKTHFLGFPLNRHDRFFSTHTSTHYAVYVWQPNRSLYNDDPIESVIVWDISEPDRPRTIRRITWDTLAFYGVRQGSTPTLRSLGMDARNLYIAEEEHRWAEGGHSSLVPPRVHLVRSTGIPIVPGPGSTKQGQAGGGADGDAEVVVQGPRWVDQCGTNTDVNMPFCMRTNGARLGGAAALQQHYTPYEGSREGTTAKGEWNGSAAHSAASASTGGGSGPRGLAAEIESGIAAPTSRWPGWAPCWRHEDFPYLSVDEVVDFRAGVRIAARHCFMLETLSVHVRPSISVVELGGGGGGGDPGPDEGGPSADGGAALPGDADTSSIARIVRLEGNLRMGVARRKQKMRRAKLGIGAGSAGNGGDDDDDEGIHEEVQFADEMWEKLLGKGRICGDERWLIGEDGKGTLSVVRF